MTAMEAMMTNLLRAVGVDPEMLKKEFSSRVEQFEENIKRLNEHLTQINSRLANIENHLGIQQREVTANDSANSDQRHATHNPPALSENGGLGSGEPRIDPAYNAP